MINLKKFSKNEPTKLEEEIDRVLDCMSNLSPDDEKYAPIADQLAKLYKLKEVDSKRRMSPDALAGVATQITTVLMVLHYEHVHVVTSKAFSFIGKKIVG